ncbi:MAG: hypothetical protein V7756_12860 [Halopseudomonas sp.]|uniref:hypothetical protein n=1 Tax=Halopseudomonas sp. TaxID=2901191 RepID=UPI003001D5C4
MLQQTIPAARAAEAARISASVEQYLAAGGEVNKLPGFQQRAPRQRSSNMDERLNLITQLRAMARERYSRRYAAQCLGIADGTVYEVSRANGIRWRPDPSKTHRV